MPYYEADLTLIMQILFIICMLKYLFFD